MCVSDSECVDTCGIYDTWSVTAIEGENQKKEEENEEHEAACVINVSWREN